MLSFSAEDIDEHWDNEGTECPVPWEYADFDEESMNDDLDEDCYTSSNLRTPKCERLEDLEGEQGTPELALELSLWTTAHSSSFDGLPLPPKEYSNQPGTERRRRKLHTANSTLTSQGSNILCPPKRARKMSRNSQVEKSISLTQSTTTTSFGSSLSLLSHSFGPSQILSKASEKSQQLKLADETFNKSFDYADKYICCEESSKLTYRILYHRELSRNAIRKNFLQLLVRTLPNVGGLRRIAITRIHSTVKKLHYHLETFHLAVYYLDTALSAMIPRVEETMFKMAAMALVLASKMEEYNGLLFSNVSNGGAYTITMVSMQELANFELPMLTALNWRLESPTPYTFANYLHTLVKSSQAQIDLTNFLLLVALFDEQSRQWEGSLISHGAVIISHALQTTSKTKYYNDIALLNLVKTRLSNVTDIMTQPLLDVCQFLFNLFQKACASGKCFGHSLPIELPTSLRPSQDKLLRIEKALRMNFVPPATFDFCTNSASKSSSTTSDLGPETNDNQEVMDETGNVDSYGENSEFFHESFDISLGSFP